MSAGKGHRVLVTGGSGFLGRGIVRALLEKHPTWRIAVLDVAPPEADVASCLERVFMVDVTDHEAIKQTFDQGYVPDLVLHSAGVVPSRYSRYSTNSTDWDRVKAVNYDGTKNVLSAAVAAGCRCFVYTSSVTAIIDDLDHDYHYMDETTPTGFATLHYGKSKAMAEAYVLSPEHAEKGLKACALRPCTIIGPEDTQVVGLIHDLIAKGETSFIIGDGDNIYDWMYIDNAVYAHILAAENLLTTQTAAGQVFFITNQEPAYFWDFLAFIWAQFGHYSPFRVHIPGSWAFVVALILEWLTLLTGKPSTLDTGSVKDGVRTHFANNDKAIQILGYRPIIGLSEGVRRSCDGYKKQLRNRQST